MSDLNDRRRFAPRNSWLRHGLLAGQVAVSLVLLTGAALYLRTLQNAMRVDVGFDTRRVVILDPGLYVAGYSHARARAFYGSLLARVTSLAGVRAASLATSAPVNPGYMGMHRDVVAAGDTGTGTAPINAHVNQVSPRYFETLGIPRLRGRDFTNADDSSMPWVAVVNETLARQLWPGGEAIGQSIRFVESGRAGSAKRVVGIVRDTRTEALDAHPRAQVFIPLEQNYRVDNLLLMRVDSGTAAVSNAVREIAHLLDPTLPPASVQTIAARRSAFLSDQRLFAELTSLFGALGVLLAAIGLYGTLALAVTHRAREIGIRIALGADSGDVQWMVIREGLVITAVGLLAGVAFSVPVTPLLANGLYGVTPADPLSKLGSCVLLAAAALLACWLPSLRATHVDPLAAMRAE